MLVKKQQSDRNVFFSFLFATFKSLSLLLYDSTVLVNCPKNRVFIYPQEYDFRRLPDYVWRTISVLKNVITCEWSIFILSTHLDAFVFEMLRYSAIRAVFCYGHFKLRVTFLFGITRFSKCLTYIMRPFVNSQWYSIMRCFIQIKD